MKELNYLAHAKKTLDIAMQAESEAIRRHWLIILSGYLEAGIRFYEKEEGRGKP